MIRFEIAKWKFVARFGFHLVKVKSCKMIHATSFDDDFDYNRMY